MRLSSWQNAPTFVNGRSGFSLLRNQKWRFSPIPALWHAFCNTFGMVPDSPVPFKGRQTMTFTNASVQQLALSVLGAFVAASLFVTAAVGPAAQLI